MIRIFVIAIFLLTGPWSRLLGQALVSAHQPALSATVKAPETLIARVNGVALTERQLREEMQRIFPYYATHGGGVPASAEPEIRQKGLHDLVLHELVYQEARRRKLQVPATLFRKRLRQIQEGFSSHQAYDQAAAKKYGSVAEYERRLRQAMLVDQLWDAEVTRKSIVTRQDARAYYRRNLARFRRPQAVWLQTITIKFPKDASAAQKLEARKLAEKVLLKAKAAKDYEQFGVLAEQLSQDEWRVMMGDHKWVHRGSVTPELETVFGMKPGEISGLVESSDGYLILRANDCQPQRLMSFSEVGASLHQRLQKERRQKRAQQFEARLRRQAKIEML